jgi:hypothetical protein
MVLSQAVMCVGVLVSAGALFATPAGVLAGEQHLEFKLVVRPIDVKSVEAPNIAGQTLSAGKFFGVAYFKDGRIAVKNFISVSDLLKGLGSLRGYSTYTFEDGSSITASYTGEIKQTGLHGIYTILAGTGTYDKATGTGNFDSVAAKFKDGATLYNGTLDVKTIPMHYDFCPASTS